MIYRKRPSELTDKRPVLDALGRCRKVLIDVISKVEIGGPTARGAALITRAIDGLALILTGDETYFHLGGSAQGGDDRKWRDSGR